jgi:hypothetical protein
MGRALDIISVVLLVGGALAFGVGMYALGDSRDLSALYWLVVGGLVLRAATDLVRPRTR